MITLKDLVIELKKERELDKNNFLLKLAETFAFKILHGDKYELTYDFDPLYDHSGTLLLSKKGFEIEDYETLEDFMEEYTGEAIPTYTSGCGFVYETYEKFFYDYIMDYISKNLFVKVIKKFMDTRKEELYELLKKYKITEFDDTPQSIVFEILFNDLIGNELIELQSDMLTEIKNINAKYLFKKGKMEIENKKLLNKTEK